MEREITPKEKQEVKEAEEQTRPGRYYLPDVDIFETDECVSLLADMPGVNQESISVELNDDVLTVSGRVSADDYEGLQPLYTEYNVGNFVRRFTLPDVGRLDCDRIRAKIANGVLELTIPKAEQAKPRRIEVTAA
jgi:HSP20 family protein